MPAGDFSASAIAITEDSAAALWETSRANVGNERFNPSTAVVQAIMENDTTNLFKEYVTMPDNCLGVKIDWLEFNPTVNYDAAYTEHQSVPCVIGGDEGESKTQIYKLAKKLDTGFKIQEDQCKNYFDYNAKFAQYNLEADRALIRQLSIRLLGQLRGFSGANVVPANETNNIGKPKTGDPTVTQVNPGNMKWEDFYPYLQLVEEFNRLGNPFLLDGTSFFRQRFLAAVQNGTLSDAGALNAFGLERYYSDPRSFSLAGISKKLYYIAQGALSMAAMTHNTASVNAPEEYQPSTVGRAFRYRAPITGLVMPNGQPMYKDVYVQRTSVPIAGSNGRCREVRSFTYELPYDMFLNPKQAADSVTGVIEFEIDAAAPLVVTA